MNNIRDKIAIIGFGASGFGTYLGLKEKGFKNIYIYDQKILDKKIEVDEWNEKNLKKNYKILKNKLGLSTANSKTFFGNNLGSINFKKLKIHDNKIGGGLLNYWGGVLQTFDRNTIKSMFQNDDFDNYYNSLNLAICALIFILYFFKKHSI